MADRRTLGAIAGAYVLARLALLGSMGPVGAHADTESYRAGVSLLGDAPRTWPFPLALDVFGDRGVTVLQTVVSGVAFFVLACTLGGQMRDRRVGWGLGGLMLLLGLAPRVTTWDQMLLTESLAISLTALLIASLVQLDRLPWWAVAGVFTLWVFIRDGHLFLGVLVVVGVCWWARKRRTVALPAVMVVVLLWCGLAAQNDRYVEGFNVAANIGGRIVYEDRGEVEWFFDRGMPPSDAFGVIDSQLMRTRFLYDDEEFADWADHEGVGTYARYLVSHPMFLASALRYVFTDDPGGQMGITESLTDHSWGQVDEFGYPFGPAIVWPASGTWTLVLLVLALIALLDGERRRALDRRWVLPGLLLASTPFHALMAWHATPYEIARHGVVMAFVLVVSCWWMIALAVDSRLRDRATDPVVVLLGATAGPHAGLVASGDRGIGDGDLGHR